MSVMTWGELAEGIWTLTVSDTVRLCFKSEWNVFQKICLATV